MSCVILIFFEVDFCCPSLLSNLALCSHITKLRLNTVLHFSLPVSYTLCVTVGGVLDVKVTSQRTALTLACSATTGDAAGLCVVLHLQIVRSNRLSQFLVCRSLALVFNSPAVGHRIECESRHAGITQCFDLNFVLTSGGVYTLVLTDVTVVSGDDIYLGIFQATDEFFLRGCYNTHINPGILFTILCSLFYSHSSLPPEAVIITHEGSLRVDSIQRVSGHSLFSRATFDRIVGRQIEIQILTYTLLTQCSNVVNHAGFLGDDLYLQATLFCVVQNVSQHCGEVRHPVAKGLNSQTTVAV